LASMRTACTAVEEDGFVGAIVSFGERCFRTSPSGF
jgi:hypothetical protein